jgi:hypothetical protein
MSYFFPEGSKFQFSTTFASAKTVTVATNANPAVLTSTTHGYTTNDEFLFTSGWEDATNSIFKANVLTADTLGVLGLNTTDTNYFGAGSGLGTMQKVSSWTDIPQVLSISTSGGDARFTTVNPLASRNSLNIPTGFNAASMTLTLGHDPSLAAYQSMLNISRTLQKTAFKMLLSGGATMYGYGYMSVNEAPQLSSGQVNQVQAAITILGRAISYA